MKTSGVQESVGAGPHQLMLTVQVQKHMTRVTLITSGGQHTSHHVLLHAESCTFYSQHNGHHECATHLRVHMDIFPVGVPGLWLSRAGAGTP